jgi:hypothetical protein
LFNQRRDDLILELIRQLREAERTIVEKDKLIEQQAAALKRPTIAVMSPEYVIALGDVLGDLIYERLSDQIEVVSTDRKKVVN